MEDVENQGRLIAANTDQVRALNYQTSDLSDCFNKYLINKQFNLIKT